MKRQFALLLVPAVICLVSSCVTTEMPPPSGPDYGGYPQPGVRTPPIEWELRPSGRGYDVSVVVDRDVYHLASGGEHMSARRVSRSSRDVPPGTISAFEVLLPDGETDLYWVEEGRPGTLVVFQKFYDAMDHRWSRERRLRTIPY